MTEIYDNNGKTIIYKYNAQGLRTSKTVNGDTTSYLYEGSKVIQMTKNVGENQYVIYFVYDANGLLIGLNTAEGQYFYRRDITGNIMGILDSNGNYIVRYKYDAWGNILDKQVLVDCVASHNPFLYKGYVYDEETKWYYLQSRYYIPSLCRFLSPDQFDYEDTETIGGLNLYAYCNNDPINYSDPTGCFSLSTFIATMIIGAIFGAITGGVANAIKQGISKQDWSWSEFGLSILGGFVSGAISSISFEIANPFIKYSLQFLLGGLASTVNVAITTGD